MSYLKIATKGTFAWLQRCIFLLLIICIQWVGSASTAQAQVAYGISRTFTYIVNPTTGAFSTPTVANDFATPLGYQASAMAVSPWNGLIYVIERTTSTTPRLGTWDPATGTSTNLGALTSAATSDILRATFCPDGRFYIQGNGSLGGVGSEIFEINPRTRAVIRTIVGTNIGTNANGSGDLTCDTNGNMYLVSQTGTAATATYALYSLSNAQMVAGGSQAATVIGTLDNLFVANPPVGIVEVDPGVPGCAAAPNPCLLISSFTNPNAWSINSTNAAVNTLTVGIGAASTDMSREFKRDVSVTKTTTPTVSLQGRTITYTVTVANPGPAIAADVSVRDTLTTTIFNVPAASWTCSVATAGTPTALTTACAAASGTGNLSTTVSLSIGGTVIFVITAPVLQTATGTVTNTAVANLTGTVFDSALSNNIVTLTSSIQKAANLSVTKTNNVTTLTAGQTVNYTVTFTNSGPGDANGATVTDVASAGLSNCSVVSCTPTGAATCPATPANILNAGGTTLPSFPPSTSVSFVVRCGVTATGF